MSFRDADLEIRSRFTEALAVINYLRSISPAPPQPLDDLQKSLRGLCLVSIYAAFERSLNAVVEAAIKESSEQHIRSIDFVPSMQALLHYPRLQAINDCGGPRLVDLSHDLFKASYSENVVSINENPIADKLQNVDGGTLVWVAGIFGLESYSVSQPNHGRLGTLRERRNAIAHGREAASKVGERYSIDELSRVYISADSEVTRFRLEMERHCAHQGYVRALV